MKTINNRYATRRGEPMCSPRYPHTVAMEGRHIGLPLRWMNAVGRYIGLLGIHIGLPLLFLAACTQDDIAPAHNDAPLTITATIPGDVWAVATRAEGESTVTYSNWTLHYTDYQGQAATGTLTATPSQDGTYTLTSDNDLVWAKVQDTQDADETFHLTCKDSDGTTYYATTTAAHGAQAVAFTTAMKPTLAKLTVNFTLSHNMATAPEANDFAISINAKMEADSYDPMTHGGTWPIGDDVFEGGPIFSQQSAATYTYTVTAFKLLPQQTMGETLTVTYNNGTADNFEDDISWTLDLSTVAVTGGVEGQKANQLIAGQHLTLNLKAGLTAINTPSDIQIEAFTAADADDYTLDLGGVAKTYEYDAANYTYYIYHEKCIEAALADRAANNRTDAAIVSKAATLAIVDGAETNLATIQAAIARKSTVIVTGEALAPYSNENIEDEAKTVVGEAIRQLETSTTFSIVLPDATSIGDYAFRGCTALTSVSLPAATSIGVVAFQSCKTLTSVSLPEATTIWNSAFNGCAALASVSAPKATLIGKSSFSNCADLTSVSLPAATLIGETAFTNCTALESLSLPAAKTIGDCAFQACTALKSVSLPDVTEIGIYAFNGCTALKSVSLPDVTEIGIYAFSICADLTSVSLPAATSIGKGAFSNCADLTSVSLPAATTIWNSAFNGCYALTSVSAPKATTIWNYAFNGCTALTSLTFGSVITSVGTDVFSRVPTENCDLTLAAGQQHMTVASSEVPSTPNGTPVTAADASADAVARTWAGATWKSITLK